MITFFGIRRLDGKFSLPSDMEPVIFRVTIWEWMPLKSLILEASQKNNLENNWAMVDPNLLVWNVFDAVDNPKGCYDLSCCLSDIISQTNTSVFVFDCDVSEEDQAIMKMLREMLAEEIGDEEVDPASIQFTHPLTFEINRDRVVEFIGFLRECEYFWIC